MDVDAASIMSSCMVHGVACLNTSDHLPISVTVEVPVDCTENTDDNSARIDWTKAELSSATVSFQAAVSEIVNQLIGSMHDSIDSINEEIQLVTKHIVNAAKQTLPCVKPRKRKFFRDSTLKQICAFDFHSIFCHTLLSSQLQLMLFLGSLKMKQFLLFCSFSNTLVRIKVEHLNPKLHCSECIYQTLKGVQLFP